MRAPAVLAAAGWGGALAKPSAVPVATPGPNWTGFRDAADTGQGSGGTYVLNRSLRGNGPDLAYPWRQPSTCNIAEPDGMWIDPADNEVVVMGSSGDPNTIATILEEVVVIVEGGTPVVVPGWQFQIGAHGVPGYRVKLGQGALHAGKWGPVTVTAITRPHNGYEKAITKTFILDEFGVANRQVFYVAPKDYAGSVARGSATSQLFMAKNKATPFATINAALAAATIANGAGPGPVIKLLAGTHLQDDAGLKGNENPFLITVQADDGLDKSQVVLDRTPPLSNPYMAKLNLVDGKYTVVTSMVSARNVLFKNLTQKWTYTGAFQLFAGAGSGRYYFQNVIHRDDNGATGPTVDTLNAITDPDMASGHGGFGYFAATTLDYPLGGNDGTWFAFMECDMDVPCLKGLNGDVFRRNVNLACGGDAVFIGSGRARKRVAFDGVPALDNEDLLYVNVVESMPGATPWKSRFHDAPTLGVQSFQPIPSSKASPATASIPGMGPANTVTSTYGFTIVTWKPTSNDAEATPVTFLPFLYNNADNIVRFVSGKLERKQGDDTTLGYQILCIGKALTVTINGTDYQLAAHQSLVKGDLSATAFGSIVVGDRAVCFGKYHSDSLQYGGARLDGPNYRNHIYWNFRAYGPGVGNMILLAPNNNDAHSMHCDIEGNFSLENGVPPVRVVHNLYGGIRFDAPPAAIDGVALQPGDRILCTQNQFSQEKAGIYVYNGPGAPLTRSSDPLVKSCLVKVLEGANFANTLYRLDLARGATSFTLGLDKIYFNACTICLLDSITTLMPGGKSNDYTSGLVVQLNADGYSGRLNRPFVDTKGNPVALAAGTAVTRVKGIIDSAFVNVTVQSPNLGQMIGGLVNLHFLYGSFWQGWSIRVGNQLAAQDVVLRGCAMGPSGFGNIDPEPRKNWHVIDSVLRASIYQPNRWYNDVQSKTSVPRLEQSPDALTVSGTLRRIATPVTIPFDINNKPRVIGGLIGAAAS